MSEALGLAIDSNATTTVLAIVAAVLSFVIALLVFLCERLVFGERRSPDGSVTIQFGGCDGEIPNCIPITQEWNYTVRLFLPRREILDGTWRFPEAQPLS